MSAGTRSPVAGLNVLMLGINYWPEPVGIAPYTTGMAEFLFESGATVRVLAGIPHYPSWRVPTTYKNRPVVRDSRNGVDIVRLRHFVPKRMNPAGRAAYEATFFSHAVSRGWAERPDLVLATTPALGGALAAAILARRAKCPMAVVVQDLMAKAATQSGMIGADRVARATAWLERKALSEADAIAIVSESFRSTIQTYGIPAERVSLLPNWSHITPSKVSKADARRQLAWPTDRFLAVHTGNMGFKQDLGNVIEAARYLQTSPVQVVLVGDGSQRDVLERQAFGLENITFVDLVSESLYPVVLAAADVLLLNERSTVVEMSMPSKITSYLAAGRPIVAAITKDGASYRYLQGINNAVEFVQPSNARLLATTLSRLIGMDGELDLMGRAATEHATLELTRDVSLNSLAALLGRLATSHVGSGETNRLTKRTK